MPITRYDEEGNSYEVPTKEEIDALMAKANKADELESKLPELEELANKTPKELREALKSKNRIIEDLKKIGKTLNERDEIIELDEKPLRMEEIEKRVEEKISKEFLSSEIERQFKVVPEEYRALARNKFDKLTNGEKLNSENIGSFIEEARRIVVPQKTMADRAFGYANHTAPVMGKEDEKTGEDLSKALGLPTFKK